MESLDRQFNFLPRFISSRVDNILVSIVPIYMFGGKKKYVYHNYSNMDWINIGIKFCVVLFE